jgi:hypothetical protein
MTVETQEERIAERRALKACLLADALEQAGVTKADLVLDLPEKSWALATAFVNANTAHRIGRPSTATQALTFVELRRREQARARNDWEVVEEPDWMLPWRVRHIPTGWTSWWAEATRALAQEDIDTGLAADRRESVPQFGPLPGQKLGRGDG